MDFGSFAHRRTAARVFRFEDLGDGMLAHLDHKTNVLRLDREQWGRLSSTDQHIVERTKARFVFVEFRDGRAPVITQIGVKEKA